MLRTHEAVLGFIGCIAKLSRVPHQWRADSLVIFKPVPKAAEDLTGSATPSGPVPQPSEEAPAVTEEPKDETAATPPEVGQTAAVAVVDAGNGDMV